MIRSSHYRYSIKLIFCQPTYICGSLCPGRSMVVWSKDSIGRWPHFSDSHGLGLFGFYYCFSCYGLVPQGFLGWHLVNQGFGFRTRHMLLFFFFAKPHVALLLVPTVIVTTSMINEIFCLSKKINKFNSTNHLCGTYFEMSPRQSRISLVYLGLQMN